MTNQNKKNANVMHKFRIQTIRLKEHDLYNLYDLSELEELINVQQILLFTNGVFHAVVYEQEITSY